MKSKQTPFYLLTIALFFSIVSPNLFSDGMFMDGLMYAAISKNLAHGVGSFWNLYFSNTLYAHFHEHPPLAFGLQSLFFRFLGDGYLVERIYSLSTYLLTGFIIVRIWKKIATKEVNSLAWLPLLLWISVPLVTWGASNNMLENSMMVFITLSVLFTIKSYESNRFINIVVAGIMIFFAVLTKGPVGLFPLAMPFWIFVFKREISFKRFIIDTSALLLSIAGSFLLIFILFPESVQSLSSYFNRQIVESLSLAHTVGSRFYIIKRFLMEMIPMVTIAILVLLLSKKYSGIVNKPVWAAIFFLFGLSGVIPIMISMKQGGFYILPATPFFSIAIALAIAHRVKYLLRRLDVGGIRFTVFKYISFVLLLLSLSINILQVNRIGRDVNKLEDVYSLIDVLPGDAIISMEPAMYEDWSLAGYFARYSDISLDGHTPFNHEYLLVRKGYKSDFLSGYDKDTLNLHLFSLYNKK